MPATKKKTSKKECESPGVYPIIRTTLNLSQKECISDNTDYFVVNWSEVDIVIMNKYNPDDIRYIDTYGKTIQTIINKILKPHHNQSFY